MTDDHPNAHFGADLTLDQYQAFASETDLDPASTDPEIPLLGLAGEVGQLLAEYKKRIRPGGESYIGFEEVMPIEIGDILWYLATLARRTGSSLSEVAHLNLSRPATGTSPATGCSRTPSTTGSPKPSGSLDSSAPPSRPTR